MKTRLFLWLLLTSFVLMSAVAKAQTPASPVTATIDASKVGTPISHYLYGQFIEHAGNLIYSSLWCEMLDDRKFFYPVQPAPPADLNDGRVRPRPARPGRRRGVGPGRWNSIGPADSVLMDTHSPFVGDQTPRVTLAGGEPHGIRQTGVNFVQGTRYNGRI